MIDMCNVILFKNKQQNSTITTILILIMQKRYFKANTLTNYIIAQQEQIRHETARWACCGLPRAVGRKPKSVRQMN